ncbi:hypothetical protein [Ferruginibacter sp. HRS2-29]|uniref:hypothetical protein n=1 Tax=Ferruginibacter sp. HRS2-29 TaxID=2487334 RepID=UPI0020CF1B83|nr:hypothetical protein [Ferruginibacter sp. HRS2-29]MCP9751202.1 hypothetical protein [Ferruginibacter sp. HRS2-29]
MEKLIYNTDPTKQYDGPDFEEYCISEAKYLPASRDRAPCISCPLNNLCIPGFEEQVRKLQMGENPSLTESCSFEPDRLLTENLFKGLTVEQIEFLKKHIPNI